MIVTRFISFTKNFVTCSYQVTKMFRSGHDCISTSSARSPRYFRLHADIATWVLRKVRVDSKLTRTRFHFCSRFPLEVHEMTWKCLDFFALGFIEALKDYANKCSLNSCSQSAIHAKIFFVFLSIPYFYFGFRFLSFHAAGLPEALHSYSHFFLVLDFRCICCHQKRNPVMKMMEK